MSILSGIFSSNDSSEGNSSDLLSVLDVGLSAEGSYESYDQTVDDDGSSHTSYDAGSFGTSLDTSSLISNMTDSFSDSDSDSGIFG